MKQKKGSIFFHLVFQSQHKILPQNCTLCSKSVRSNGFSLR